MPRAVTGVAEQRRRSEPYASFGGDHVPAMTGTLFRIRAGEN